MSQGHLDSVSSPTQANALIYRQRGLVHRVCHLKDAQFLFQHISNFLRNFILFKSLSAEQPLFNDFVLSRVNPPPYSLDILTPLVFQRPK